MKVKTSLSLSSDLLEELGKITPEGGRSEFIEKALWRYLELVNRDIRDRRDLELLNSSQPSLNEEALDTLGYQAPL